MNYWEQICCAVFKQDVVSIWSHVNENAKINKYIKWQKYKIWNFANLYTTVVESLHRSMHDFWSESVMYLQRS